MNLKAEIEKEHSKAQATKIATYIGNNQHLFDHLMELFLKEGYRITQRAAWVIRLCVDKYPELIEPYLNEIIENLNRPVHDAVKRNTLSILQHKEIPGDQMGSLATICFDFLTSRQEPVAIKVFAMTILANIAQKEPDLKQELKICIEDQLPFASAAFVSRGKKVLEKLKH